MGRKRQYNPQQVHRTMKRDFKQARDNVWDEHRTKPGGWAEHDMNNEDFERYYKAQKIVLEEEWDTFMAHLRKPLPTTFRINGSGKFADDLRDRLENDFFSQFNDGPMMVNNEELLPPRPLTWYPGNLAWHFAFSRSQLRKVPVLGEIHELLKRENDAGSITRQEAVSMVPPLLLDVRPEHKVLDTCAAPGSKTAQILEMLHEGTAMPTGVVVANDAEAQRCNLLTHQTKRMCSPALLVTNHDASQFPQIAPRCAPKEGILFDRILCDVPCTGDGTLRKAPDIWRRWTHANGNGLHSLQVRIAHRGAALLQVGGRMIYSTCSFNPVENEAVVAELLRRCEGALELVDVSAELPDLRRTPGLRTWVVRNQGQMHASWQAAGQNAAALGAKQMEKMAQLGKLAASMFPGEASTALPLERCLRILPHHNDTGGFFVAVLRKIAPLPDAPAGAKGTASAPQKGATPAAALALEAPAPEALEAVMTSKPEEGGPAPGGAGPERGGTLAAAHAEMVDLAREAAAYAQDFATAVADMDVEGATSTAEGAAQCVAGIAEAFQSHSVEGGQAQADPLSGNTVPTQTAEQTVLPATLSAPPSTPAEGADLSRAFDNSSHAPASVAEDSSKAGERLNAGAATIMELGWGTASGPKSSTVAAGPITAADAKATGRASSAAVGSTRPAAPQWGPRGGGARGREGGGRWAGIDPVIPFMHAESLAAIRTFYGLAEDFPLEGRVVSRSQPDVAKPKRVYYVNAGTPGGSKPQAPGVKEVLLNDEAEQLKVVATGLKILERQEMKAPMGATGACSYRIVQEGLPLLLPYISRQRMHLPVSEFLRLVEERSLALPPSHHLRDTAPDKCNGDTKLAAAGEDAEAIAEEPWGSKQDASLDDTMPPDAKRAKLLPELAEEAGGHAAGQCTGSPAHIVEAVAMTGDQSTLNPGTTAQEAAVEPKVEGQGAVQPNAEGGGPVMAEPMDKDRTAGGAVPATAVNLEPGTAAAPLAVPRVAKLELGTRQTTAGAVKAEPGAVKPEPGVVETSAALAGQIGHLNQEVGSTESTRTTPRVKADDSREDTRIPLSDADTLAELQGVQGGCCICVLRPEDARAIGQEALAPDGLTAHAPLALACWRGKTSITVLVSKLECTQLAEKVNAGLKRHTAANVNQKT